MSRFALLSIKQRLLLIILSVTLSATMITMLSITVMGVVTLKNNLQSEIESTAAIVGERNSTAISFDAQNDVTENLEKIFQGNPSFESACVYLRDGRLYTFFKRGATFPSGQVSPEEFAKLSGCPKFEQQFTEFTSKRLHTFRFIHLPNGGRVGGIYISKNLDSIDSYVEKQIFTSILVLIIVASIAYLMAIRLQKSISTPILRLADTALHVSIHKDFSVRVEGVENTATSMNEIDTLVEAFNSMLTEIEDRDGKLQRKNIELEKAKEEAEAANLSKSRFLASISHELRTPLNAIIGFSSIITSQLFGAINTKYHEYAADIHDSGLHLLEIINDILDLSKAEAGKLTLEMEEFSVDKALRKCTNIMSERAAKGKISISASVPENLPYIVADRVRFIQIFLNIVSNAVKFTEPGGRVHISAEARPLGDNKLHFRFIVSDTGIGMAQEDIDKAFQSFGQIDSGLNRKYEGTGLGLPLTKKLVELHKGTIQLESEIGVGTKVTIDLISDPATLKSVFNT